MLAHHDVPTLTQPGQRPVSRLSRGAPAPRGRRSCPARRARRRRGGPRRSRGRGRAMPVSARPEPGHRRKTSSWCSWEVPPLIAPPTRLALRASSSRGPSTRRARTREPKPGASRSMRACIRSANRSQSSRSQTPRMPPVAGVAHGRPAGRGCRPTTTRCPPATGWGRWSSSVRPAGTAARARRRPRPGRDASAICSTESATCTVPGAYAGAARPRDRAVEGPVDLDRATGRAGRRACPRAPARAGPRRRPAGRTGCGRDDVGDHGAARRRTRSPSTSADAGRAAVGRRRCRVDLGVAADLAAQRLAAAGPAPGRARRRRPRARGSRRSARASPAASPSARSRARRAGCRRGRRCRRAAAAASRPPNRVRPSSAAGVSRVFTKREATDRGAGGPGGRAPAGPAGTGVSRPPTRCGPIRSHSSHSRSQASPSPGCCASISAAVTSRSRCSRAQLAVRRRVAEHRRRVPPGQPVLLEPEGADRTARRPRAGRRR